MENDRLVGENVELVLNGVTVGDYSIEKIIIPSAIIKDITDGSINVTIPIKDKKIKLYQCLLTKVVNGGYVHMVAWIPKKFTTHLLLSLKNEDGIWNDGWKIDMIYGCQDEDFIFENKSNWTKMVECKDYKRK